jgi:CubicO group peptidase (beta-lactamase class C family)
MMLQRRTFLRSVGSAAAALGAGSAFPLRVFADAGSTPESQGVASHAVSSFLSATPNAGHELHSFMMARHGRVIVEGWWAPYRSEAIHRFYSLSKSFTATAVGFAVAEGRFKVTDRVVQFFPDRLPRTVSENLAALRVRDLLTMSVGRAQDSAPLITKEQDWVKTFLSLPIEHRPGSVFLYDSGATYMLSAIVQKACGEKLIDYLQSRLFAPLGMTGMEWSVCPRGINTGGWGLSATTQTLTTFGQFYLQEGRWNDRQLLPRQWIQEATTSHIQQPPAWLAPAGTDLAALKRTSDWHQGYGYQFWRCRHGAFRGDGAFGQFCVVLPKQQTVIAMTSRTSDMQGLLDTVWKHLLPGIHDGPLPESAVAASTLRRELASLALPLPSASARPTMHPERQTRRFVLEPNSLNARSVSFRFDANTCDFALETAEHRVVVRCGIGSWSDGVVDMPGSPPEITELVGVDASPRRPSRIAAAGAWKNEDTFEMQWRFYETPHYDIVVARFAGDRVEIEFNNSITQMMAAHLETRPILKGTLQPVGRTNSP